jgi:putative intracellular protease/amidase
MQSKILIVLTSHNSLGNTGKETGFYLPEVSHPEAVFTDAGFVVDYVSPKGGKAPMIGIDLQDSVNKAFLDNPDKVKQVENTLTPKQVRPSEYSAIFYAGGHGTMWDFPNNQELADIAKAIYESGGVVGAVCHGPAGLVNIKLSGGEYLVTGKTVSCFTNEEETAVELTDIVPFSLEDKLTKLGAVVEKAPNFEAKVIASQRLVTGQNPASSMGVAQEIVKLLKL